MIELLQQSIDALNKARRQIVNAKVIPHAFITETIADLHKAVNKLKEQSNCKNCNCIDDDDDDFEFINVN